MSRFFRKKTNPYNLRSKGKLRGKNTPSARVDACVETDLPFDESDIAPEVRQGSTAEKDTDSEPFENHQRDSDKFNRTNLELVDISEVSTSEDSSDSLAPPCPGNTEDTEEIYTLTEEIDIFQEEENFTDTALATGGQQVPESTLHLVDHTSFMPPGTTSVVNNSTTSGRQQLPIITSPGDIYEHFQRGSYEGGLLCDDSPSADSSPLLVSLTDADTSSITSSSADSSISTTMEGEYIRALQELTQKLLSKDVHINKYHGYENEDINCWFEKLELVLESKGISLDVPAARTQLINNLAGPAETFMFELPPEERGSFMLLKQALVKRYSTKDRAWVKRRRLVARRQGPHELLSDYINDMHELFSGLNIAEVDKVTYFTEGLTQPLKIKVLKRMPETLLQAEEVARTVNSISQCENTTKEGDQIERLIEVLNRSQQVPAQVPSNRACNTLQPQLVQAHLEKLTEGLDGLMPITTQSNKVAACSEPRGNYERKQDKLTSLMQCMEGQLQDQIKNLDRRFDARINGLAQRRQGTRGNRERSRDGRPVCYRCGMMGHFQNSCPQRDTDQRQLVPRYPNTAPNNNVRYSAGPQSRLRALPSAQSQNRVAVLGNDGVTPSGHYMIDATPNRAPNLHTEEPFYHEPYNGMNYNYDYYADDLENDEMDEWDYDYEHYNADLAYDGVGDFDAAPYAEDPVPPSSISSIRRESPHNSSTHQFQPYFAHLRNEGPSYCQERK